jgi:hypothetical protein
MTHGRTRLHARCAAETTTRYKYVVQVFIGEQKGAGVR